MRGLQYSKKNRQLVENVLWFFVNLPPAGLLRKTYKVEGERRRSCCCSDWYANAISVFDKTAIRIHELTMCYLYISLKFSGACAICFEPNSVAVSYFLQHLSRKEDSRGSKYAKNGEESAKVSTFNAYWFVGASLICCDLKNANIYRNMLLISIIDYANPFIC